LAVIASIDEVDAWKGDGARDLAHWVSMRYGVSQWKAHRMVGASRALSGLPGLAEALASGVLGLDKVLELSRFAASETEHGLIAWGERVSVGAVRRRADREVRADVDRDVEAHDGRFLRYGFLADERRMGLEAELPVAEGARVVKAIERMAATIPAMPGEEHDLDIASRRADALVALCSAGAATPGDPDRATVVIHAQADGLASGTHGAELEAGPVLHPEVVRRYLCNARVQTVVEDPAGRVLDAGRSQRTPSAALLRQIRYRDRECRFPGCGATRFTEAHHIVWWRDGGRSDLDNLVLICSFHHRLVHELGWRLRHVAVRGHVEWFRPDGRRYRCGPAPPQRQAA
jgi:Domain of unknown function (DUF222)/HNH endonuclease